MFFVYILLGILTLVFIGRAVENIKVNHGYISYLKPFLTKDKRKLRNEKKLMSPRLDKVDKLFEDNYYTREAVLKPIKSNSTLVMDTSSVKYKVKEYLEKDIVVPSKEKIKEIESSFLDDLNRCTYDALPNMLKRLKLVIDEMDEITCSIKDLTSMKVLDTILTCDEKSRYTSQNISIVDKLLKYECDSIETFKNATIYELKNNYKDKRENLKVLNYNILNYNEHYVKKLYSLNDEFLIGKITECLTDLGFTVSKINTNLIKVYNPKNDLTFITYLIRGNTNTASLEKKVIGMKEIQNILELCRTNIELRNYTKITLITNIDFTQDAYEFICDNEKMECLTLHTLLQVGILDKNELNKRNVSLIGEMLKRKEMVS